MSLSHMILGLLDMNPMSGYDLNKEFSNSVNHFWMTDQSQIYRALQKLHKDKLVHIELVVQDGNPNKKVYHLTEAGQQELQRWIATPLDTPPVRLAWLGQIFFAGEENLSSLLNVLETYQREMQQYYQSLDDLQQMLASQIGDHEVPVRYQLRLMTLDYGIGVMRYELEWLAGAIEQIKEMGN